MVAEFGRRVIVLGMTWRTSMDEHVSFTVNEMIGIKGIKWPDAIMDMAAADAGEEADKINLMRATMLLLSAEIGQLITDLLDALGGEEIPNNSDWEEDGWLRMLAALGNITEINGVAVGDLEQAARDSHARVNKIVGDDLEQAARDSHARVNKIVGDDDVDNALLVKATAWVRETKRCSISAIQRHFTIGYNRAARIVECLETLGVVTEMNSNGAREVIATGAKLHDDMASLLEDLPAGELDDDEDVI